MVLACPSLRLDIIDPPCGYWSRTMPKILIVDDEPLVLGFLQELFDGAGYETVGALDGASGLREFYAARPDVAVVDLLIPEPDGLELCRRIRQMSHTPIVVLTGLLGVDEKVRAFTAGADDYVTKPPSGPELIARVEACLRRARWSATGAVPSVYTDAYLTVDFARHEVYVDGERKNLTPIEYSLISQFVQRPGEALSVEYLLTNVWGREYDTFDLVKWHVGNLRKKIENRAGEPVPIVTVRGYGYRYERLV